MSDLRRPLGEVLVALDLSPTSSLVLDRAVLLPVTPGSKIVLLHVVHERIGRPPDVVAQDVAHARAQLEEHAARVAPRLGPGVELVVSVTVGVPFVEIVRRAYDQHAELVVLGRHGHRGFADALLGSTAERIFRKGTTPALIVNQEPAGRGYLRALVAVDLSETSRTAAEVALRLLAAPDAEVCVIHADDGRAWDVTEAILCFLEPFQKAGVRWEVVNRRGDARAVILAQAAATAPDLLVLGTHGHSRLVQQVVGSVAEAVVRGARCDVLVARPPGTPLRLP